MLIPKCETLGPRGNLNVYSLILHDVIRLSNLLEWV